MPVKSILPRLSRRALTQSAIGGALTLPLLTPLPTLATPQASALPTLRVANQSEPTSLDPYMRGYAQTLVTRQIYEPLVDIRMSLVEGSDTDVLVEDIPLLAESWERVDDLTWRFSIRQGVTFHNGEVLDAAAIKAS